MRVFDANPKVEEALQERGRLWHREPFTHQYPHCWRCHNPVIFLATSQWFIRWTAVRAATSTTATTAGAARCAEAALDAVDNDVTWVPPWGHDRIYNMLANRPGLGASTRQRAGGVPNPRR
jgi:isoleucyl-tRNA synthetase